MLAPARLPTGWGAAVALALLWWVMAVSSVIGSPAVAWSDDDGTPYVGKGPLPVGNYSPFAPAGDLYFVDIHISVNPDGSFGPVDKMGNVFRVPFTAGVPSPPAAIATGLSYPTSVTAWDPTAQTCPM